MTATTWNGVVTVYTLENGHSVPKEYSVRLIQGVQKAERSNEKGRLHFTDHVCLMKYDGIWIQISCSEVSKVANLLAKQD